MARYSQAEIAHLSHLSKVENPSKDSSIPLPNILKTAVGTCRHCGHKARILTRTHPDCRRTFDAGWAEMVALAAEAARTHTFDEKSLRLTLAEIAQRSYGDGATVNQALEEGWKQGVAHSMADGIMSQAEEAKLREFRDKLALADTGADRKSAGQLEKTSKDRLMLDARLAVLAVDYADTHLHELSQALQESELPKEEQTALLPQAWEAAVEGVLEDGLLSFDEENALARYLDHSGIDQAHADRNGAQTSMVQAAVIRELTEGVAPQRQNLTGRVPFNLMKSEKLVWVMQDVDYLDMVTRRERRGSSHGLSIRITRGVYYRPSTFRSRQVEWDEMVHVDTGLLGLTTKHLFFSGIKKKFRIRHGRIVEHEPFADGFGVMGTPRPPSHRASEPETAGSHTTWPRTWRSWSRPRLEQPTGPRQPLERPANCVT